MNSTTIATDHPLTTEEQALLRKLAGLIIPASNKFKLPGAHEEPVFSDILKSAPSQLPEIKAALEFALQFSDDLEDHVDTLQAATELVPVVVLVMQCYYRADDVLLSLGMEARAPYPKGFEIEQGDWSMLEAVQQRGKIWRDT